VAGADRQARPQVRHEFRGVAVHGDSRSCHWIELDLGDMGWAKPLRLIIDGYTDYFTATSMYAADQAGIKVIPPYVEAPRCARQVGACRGRYGFPAGLERTMVADLTGKLPAGTRRIRIVNQSEDLLGRDSNRPDTGRTGCARGTSCRSQRRRWMSWAIRARSG